jgi:hypothetical protein
MSTAKEIDTLADVFGDSSQYITLEKNMLWRPKRAKEKRAPLWTSKDLAERYGKTSCSISKHLTLGNVGCLTDSKGLRRYTLKEALACLVNRKVITKEESLK